MKLLVPQNLNFANQQASYITLEDWRVVWSKHGNNSTDPNRGPITVFFGQIVYRFCEPLVLLLEEILHQLVVFIVIHKVSYIPKWCKISSINNIKASSSKTAGAHRIWVDRTNTASGLEAKPPLPPFGPKRQDASEISRCTSKQEMFLTKRCGQFFFMTWF